MSKTIFITGGSSGIGKCIGEYLTQKGYEVYGSSRNPEKVSVDFLNRSHEYIRLDSNKIPKENSSFQNTKTIPEESVMIQTQNNTGVNPIEEELKSFINYIATNINPTVDLESAKMALKLTIDIMEQITMAQN